MNSIQKIKITLSFLLLFALFSLLGRELFYAKPNELPSALIGEPLPAFKLTTLYPNSEWFTPQLLHGQVSLLNVWATWCYACSLEQPMLMKIRNVYHIPVFGLDYKDNPFTAKKWLQENGNPYTLIGNDDKGNTAMDLGVYGTPETFIISAQGTILYRHVGAIDQQTWDQVLYPLIQKAQQL